LVNRIYQPKGGRVQLDADDLDRVLEWEDLQRAESEAKKKKDLTKAHLVERLGEATEGLLPDGRMLTRNLVERAGYTCPATTYPDFRVKKQPKTKERK
jgi:hypothetical protein